MSTTIRDEGPVDPIIGRMIFDFRIVRKLGEGGMGAVYLAQHLTLRNSLKAVKVATSLDVDMDRFRQEAFVADTINCDGIVRVEAIGEFADGIPWIMMEFVRGPTLEKVLRERGPFSVEDALTIVFRLADTMIRAQACGVTHRDLKPANILFVDPDGKGHQVKIGDFGVARATGDKKLAHTGERALIGTAGYMSAEAALGAGTDGRTDIFALGVILYELLTGQLPFPRKLAPEEILQFLAMPVPSVASKRPVHLDPVPTSLEHILARALARRPEERFLTMVAFREALRPLAPNAMKTLLAEIGDANAPHPTLRPITEVGRAVEAGHASQGQAGGNDSLSHRSDHSR